MAIFKNRKEYSGYVTKRIWTFVQSNCQREEEFYVHQAWMDEDKTEFAFRYRDLLSFEVEIGSPISE